MSQVKLSEVREMLVALGVDTAAGWDAKTAQAKIGRGVAHYLGDGQTAAGIADLSARRLFEAIDADQRAGHTVEVIDDTGGPAPAAANKKKGGDKVAKTKAKPAKKAAKGKAKVKAAKPSGNGKHKPSGNGTAGMTWKEKLVYWKKHPKPISDRGPGILRAIVDELKAAGKGANPAGVTKEHLLGVLAAKFTDRAADKMETYLNNMLPTGLRDEYGVHVRSRRPEGELTHYWIVGDGKNPQPKTKAKAKAAK